MMDKKTMYTLGQIYRAIWPGIGRDNHAPTGIAEVALTKPASGLAMMLRHHDNSAAKQDEVMELVDRLGDITDPPGGVPDEVQLHFWLGYYHYLTATMAAKKYGADELRLAGEVLFGDRWQTDMSRELGLTDARRIRQWLSGDRPIPVGVWADVCGLLRQRQMTIDKVLDELDGK